MQMAITVFTENGCNLKSYYISEKSLKTEKLKKYIFINLIKDEVLIFNGYYYLQLTLV